jgi:hypothetical protein
MITYRSRFLKRGEVWFDNEPGDALRRVDWALYRQRSQPVPRSTVKYFYTFLVDLPPSQEQLWAQLQKHTADKIRRARDRDKIICEYCDPRDSAVMDRFEELYNIFAATKGLPRLDRPRMESIAAAGLLEMSLAKDAQGNTLLYHANYRDKSRAALMELPSIYRTLGDSSARNFVGRANRYLIWTDILRYKAQGLKYFDFGGWYRGTDPKMLAINEFKRGFGGRVVREFQCEQVLTLKGRLVLTLAAVANGPKRLWTKLRTNPEPQVVEPAPKPEPVLPPVPVVAEPREIEKSKVLG